MFIDGVIVEIMMIINWRKNCNMLLFESGVILMGGVPACVNIGGYLSYCSVMNGGIIPIRLVYISSISL